jgi:hypothetical protein
MTREFDYKELSHQLIRQWRDENVPLNPGATEAELSAFENRLGLTLPEDFRYFYSLANGMADYEADNHFFSLWSLTRISDELVVDQTVAPIRIELAFGDVLIDSYRYLLRADDSGGVFVQINAGERLADSFTHFIKRYLSEPDKLYLLVD